MSTVTRANLAEHIYSQIGLSRNDSAALLESVLETISSTLARGETVKLSGFGTFAVRQKGRRIGRNPKTGVDKQQVVVLSFDNTGVLQKLETLNRHDGVPVGMVGETTPSPGTKTSIIQEILGNVGKYNPMSGMGSTFGGATGPMSNQGAGQGGHGNSLP